MMRRQVGGRGHTPALTRHSSSVKEGQDSVQVAGESQALLPWRRGISVWLSVEAAKMRFVVFGSPVASASESGGRPYSHSDASEVRVKWGGLFKHTFLSLKGRNVILSTSMSLTISAQYPVKNWRQMRKVQP